MRLADIWREKITCIIHTSTQEEANMLFKAVDSYDHNGTTWASRWNVYKKKTCYRTNLGEVVAYGYMDNYIGDGEEVIEFSDLVATGGVCTGFRGGKITTPKDVIRSKVERAMQEFLNIGCCRTVIPKEEKKMPTKFTFYVKEGTRPDKKCNGTIPTMTTNIELFDGNVFDKVTTIRGSATCDKTDYDERQGVLEALANAVCGGEFEKRYSKAVKANKDADLIMRTCTYCGKVCDTSEEKIEHEKWHVERRKARRERYLLRKRAKEIAFEEQAQKMAKEMMGEQK